MAAAVAIIDAEGLEALTVRRLASELGVAPMTVYSYVRGKEEILDLVVDRVAADIAAPSRSKADWREARAVALGHSLRDDAPRPSRRRASHQRAAGHESERVPALRCRSRHLPLGRLPRPRSRRRVLRVRQLRDGLCRAGHRRASRDAKTEWGRRSVARIPPTSPGSCPPSGTRTSAPSRPTSMAGRRLRRRRAPTMTPTIQQSPGSTSASSAFSMASACVRGRRGSSE